VANAQGLRERMHEASPSLAFGGGVVDLSDVVRLQRLDGREDTYDRGE